MIDNDLAAELQAALATTTDPGHAAAAVLAVIATRITDSTGPHPAKHPTIAVYERNAFRTGTAAARQEAAAQIRAAADHLRQQPARPAITVEQYRRLAEGLLDAEDAALTSAGATPDAAARYQRIWQEKVRPALLADLARMLGQTPPTTAPADPQETPART